MTPAQRLDEEPLAGDGADRLLAYLRTTLGQPDLSFRDSPTRLRGGNETFIYLFSLQHAPEHVAGPLILRAYRAGYARPDQARFEATVQNAIAGLGYPAARVFFVCQETDVLGTPFIVMQRLPGSMVLEGIGGPDASGQMRFQKPGRLLRSTGLLGEIPRICAEAQLRLHALNPQPLLDAIEQESLPRASVTVEGRLQALRTTIDDYELEALRHPFAWLAQNAPEPERLAICHSDIQPNNILMTEREITGIVDWSQVIVADPALDVGYTKVAIETVPLDMPSVLQWINRPVARIVSRGYLRRYTRRRRVRRSTIEYYEVLRALFVLAGIGARRRGAPSEPDTWDSPKGVRNLVARVRSVTSTEVRLPADTRPY